MRNLDESRKMREELGRPAEELGRPVEGSESKLVPFASRQESGGTLLPKSQADELRSRWTTVQTGFVDDPRTSVQEADKLVAAAIKEIEEVFFAQRSNLEKQWSKGDEVSTEDLRIALQHYRQFFDRLLLLGR